MAEAVGIVNLKLKVSSASLKTGLNASKGEMRSWARSVKQVVDSTRTPLEKYAAGMRKLDLMYKRMAIDAKTLARAQAQLKAQFLPTSTATSGLKTQLLGLASAYIGVYQGIRLVTQGFMRQENLSRKMNRSLAIMGDVDPGTRGAMRSQAIEIERSTIFSAQEAAEAYFFLGSAGLSAKQSLAALPTVAKFATAGNFDLARATDLLTDAQSALGLTVKETGENMANMQMVGDVIVKANTMANASAEQFAESLTSGAGASAKMYGKTIQEIMPALMVFADQGIKGADAATKLGIALRDITTKAIDFEEEFKDVGVEVFDAAGNMRQLWEIVEDLDGALAGMSDRQQKATLMMLGFSNKSLLATQMLMGTTEQMEKFKAGVDEAGGMMEEVASKQMTEMEKGLNRLSAAWSELWENVKGSKAAEESIGTVTVAVEELDSNWDMLWDTSKRAGMGKVDVPLKGIKAILAYFDAEKRFPKSTAAAAEAAAKAAETPPRERYRVDKSATEYAKEREEGVSLRAKLIADKEQAAMDKRKIDADKIKEGQVTTQQHAAEEFARTLEMVKDGFLTLDERAEYLGKINKPTFDPFAAGDKLKRDQDKRREKLEDTLKTPLEIFREKLDEYADLFGEGTDTYNALRDKLQDATVKEMMGDVRNQAVGTIAGMQLGSQGAQQFAAKLQADRIGGDLEKRQRARIVKAVEETADKDDVLTVSPDPI